MFGWCGGSLRCRRLTLARQFFAFGPQQVRLGDEALPLLL